MDKAAKMAKDLVSNREVRNPLATPPSETDVPLPSSIPLREISRSANHLVEHLTSKLQAKTSGDMQSLKSSPSLRGPPIPRIGGDAVGQPRKADAKPVRGEPYVEIEIKPEPINAASSTFTATPTPISLMTKSRPQVVSATPSSSTRGTKRGATRLPIPKMDAGRERPVNARLTTPSEPLERTGSVTSVASSVSEASRPARKRQAYDFPASSPLGKTGLSSPPPSRESSPMVADNVDMETKPLPNPPSRIPITPSRSMSRLRKIPDNVPRVGIETCGPVLADISTLPAQSTMHRNTRRSLIPSMRSILPRDKTAFKALPSLNEVAERGEDRKRTFTPPRMFGLGHRSAGKPRLWPVLLTDICSLTSSSGDLDSSSACRSRSPRMPRF